MTRPTGRHYHAGDRCRAVLSFAYLNDWRIGEILDLLRDDLDLDAGIATFVAESAKGPRTARVEVRPLLVEKLRATVELQSQEFDWTMSEPCGPIFPH